MPPLMDVLQPSSAQAPRIFSCTFLFPVLSSLFLSLRLSFFLYLALSPCLSLLFSIFLSLFISFFPFHSFPFSFFISSFFFPLSNSLVLLLKNGRPSDIGIASTKTTTSSHLASRPPPTFFILNRCKSSSGLICLVISLSTLVAGLNVSYASVPSSQVGVAWNESIIEESTRKRFGAK